MSNNRFYLFLLLLIWITPARLETIKNIVVFGDSYSDVGNGQRLTNGPLWSEHLAVGWNASLYSFAFSGAVCNNDMYSDQNDIPSIVDQVEIYYKQHLDLNKDETVFIFWVGVNDIYKIFEENKSSNEVEKELGKVVNCIATNIRNVRKVFSSNKFIVFGVPPVERMPYYADTTLAASRKKAANQLNGQLTKEVERMNKHLKSLELDLVDIHKLIDDIVDQPEVFDIKNSKDPYWDACEGQCSDSMDSYVWWDKTHLTGGIHYLIANSILMAGSLAPATYLDHTVNVNQLIHQPHSRYMSPIYKAQKNTGEIDRVIKRITDEKKEGAEHQQQHQQQKSHQSSAEQTPSKVYIYFGISATCIVSLGFILFAKRRRRRNHLAALTSLLNNPERGRFMPLRNMDDTAV
ncbi:MAG: GDSL-like Lipase/Acylhydrolase-domain-containing protein [Benjaminiella poitrasii]|nr:MAG: GDSL-like Lipase/Acylhydrolase-domain-containing protein [Benjaminiella poitrasii]